MVQLQKVGDGAEPAEKVVDILEVIVAELHQGSGGKHSLKYVINHNFLIGIFKNLSSIVLHFV